VGYVVDRDSGLGSLLLGHVSPERFRQEKPKTPAILNRAGSNQNSSKSQEGFTMVVQRGASPIGPSTHCDCYAYQDHQYRQ
jgi:hypothetical protein